MPAYFSPFTGLPVTLAETLAQNPAMHREFTALPIKEQQKLIRKARYLSGSDAMLALLRQSFPQTPL